MIGYPFTWKGELQYDLKRAQGYVERARRLGTDGAIEDARAWVEHFAAGAAFRARTLMDAGKLSAQVCGLQIKVLRFSRRAGAAAFEPGPGKDVAKQYELHSPQDTSLSLRELCNQLIHVDLSLDCVEGAHREPMGFVIASDKEKPKGCFFVRLDAFFDAMKRVCTDGFDWIVPPGWRGVPD